MEETRLPAVAGAFYPKDADEIREMLGEYMKKASPPEIKGKLRGIIVPHAGYIYSGPVAAYGYKLLQNMKLDAKRFILLGPSHYALFSGLAESGHNTWRTPLGDIQTFHIETKPNDGKISTYPTAHQPEHCLEVQLPFLQMIMPPDFLIAPLLTGEIVPSDAASLLEPYTKDSFFIISSDLSHYLPYTHAVPRDTKTIEYIENLDLPNFVAHGDACGKNAIAVAIALAKKNGWKIKKLHYANSGDTAGPKTEVVGYAALAIVEEK